MITSTANYETILKAVRDWPLSSQISLVQDLLQAMSTHHDSNAAPKDTLSEALGLLATDNPPPTDEEIDRILEEERLKKYGLS
ncbi:MAG: hypothetical protein GY943_21475 [Chloroflexi bacterium]|nr:hypothetical protein [Chloroflexota bacterium]